MLYRFTHLHRGGQVLSGKSIFLLVGFIIMVKTHRNCVIWLTKSEETVIINT